MSKKTLALRRQKLHALAIEDAHSRCRQCKLPLERVRLEMGQPFCSVDCEDDHLAFLARWEAAKVRASR